MDNGLPQRITISVKSVALNFHGSERILSREMDRATTNLLERDVLGAHQSSHKREMLWKSVCHDRLSNGLKFPFNRVANAIKPE